MTASRARLRAAVVLVAAGAVLLPASAAHAALPLDAVGGSSTSAQPASDDDDQSSADDGDDAGSQDASSSDSVDDEGEDVSTGGDDGGDATATGGAGSATAPTGGSKASTTSKAQRLGKPRAVSARLGSFDRATVVWKTGKGPRPVRIVVSLRSGRSGRLLYLPASAHAASFAALKPSTRYTATVSAVGKPGTASASVAFRTPSLSNAVRETKRAAERAERALRLAKAARFG